MTFFTGMTCSARSMSSSDVDVIPISSFLYLQNKYHCHKSNQYDEAGTPACHKEKIFLYFFQKNPPIIPCRAGEPGTLRAHFVHREMIFPLLPLLPIHQKIYLLFFFLN